jgi:alpha-beta hydrolase superfamily lysophospholipase
MEAPPPMPIAITGHSLGGALATLAAFELSTVGLIGRGSTIRGVGESPTLNLTPEP